MNKTIPLLTLALAGLLAAPSALRAEDLKPVAAAIKAKPGKGGGGGERVAPAERLKTMKENLGLTDEQAEKVKAVLKDNRDAMAKLRDDKSLSREDRRAKIKDLRQDQMAAMKEILTPDQQAKLKKNMELRREKAGKRGAAK